jgi:hypothetical protein
MSHPPIQKHPGRRGQEQQQSVSGQSSRAKAKVKVKVKPVSSACGLHLPRSARHTTA